MNELLEQFIIECRELVEAATGDLLAMETSPQDKERLDGAFRGFHTLKGAAGIVGFSAMGHVLHAAESVLASVRAGDRQVSADLIGSCLACLDQVVLWLDEIDAQGDLPASPDVAAEALMSRLVLPDPEQTATSQPAPEEKAASDTPFWLAPLLGRHPALLDAARTALRYTPDADCFFRGEDPLALVSSLPGLLALELAPVRPWPSLEELSSFECNLIVTMLSAAPPDDAATVLRTASGRVEICPIGQPGAAGPLSLGEEARAVLTEQLLLVANGEAAGFAGRLGSAARVATNVLRRAGWIEASQTIAQAAGRSQAEGNGGALIAALQVFLEPAVPQSRESPSSGASAGDFKQTAGLPGAAEGTAPRSQVASAQGARAQVARALRVDVDRIDTLVNLTGELTVVKNALGHTARLAQERADPDVLTRTLKDQYARLDRLVAELQRSVFGIRVLPLRHVFQHFPRLVREMAQELGKSVRLVIEGQATEADKATVEALFEPLLHVLRNALDHGVEPAEERIAAGKPPGATVQLRATREGDQVIVEVSDDGRGIDAMKIRQSAASIGIASADALAEMSDQAVNELIFSPGFSTAATVTSVSGRGVGMDAVRAAVLRLGGRVTVASKPGMGTSVRFTLPFTVMMVRVMTVEAGGQIFGIPIDAVIETTRVPRGQISCLGAAEAINLRDRTVPVIRLTDVLGLPASGAGADADARLVVVSVAGRNGAVQDETKQTGALEVDGFGERIDVMLKPMEGLLSGVPGFAGTTLLGDGQVLIVLDLGELLR
jgi:two-component system chemotaxis sensor kinase CheA